MEIELTINLYLIVTLIIGMIMVKSMSTIRAMKLTFNVNGMVTMGITALVAYIGGVVRVEGRDAFPNVVISK